MKFSYRVFCCGGGGGGGGGGDGVPDPNPNPKLHCRLDRLGRRVRGRRWKKRTLKSAARYTNRIAVRADITTLDWYATIVVV